MVVTIRQMLTCESTPDVLLLPVSYACRSVPLAAQGENNSLIRVTVNTTRAANDKEPNGLPETSRKQRGCSITSTDLDSKTG